MQSLTFLQFYEHCKCNYASDMHGQVHVHAGMPCKFNHICMHALHIITLKHCHIVAMGMTLLQLHNSLSSTQLTLEVLSIKHWHKSAFAETPSTARYSREARQRRASMLVYRMAGNFGGKIFWWIAENMSFGGFYFGG